MVKECKIECDGNDIFVVADGVKIAKRGHLGTAQAGMWVSLEPGWRVLDCEGTYTNESGEEVSAIEVEYIGARIH